MDISGSAFDDIVCTNCACFNPSFSMDISGSQSVPFTLVLAQTVSILVSQWIYLEVAVSSVILEIAPLFQS